MGGVMAVAEESEGEEGIKVGGGGGEHKRRAAVTEETLLRWREWRLEERSTVMAVEVRRCCRCVRPKGREGRERERASERLANSCRLV